MYENQVRMHNSILCRIGYSGDGSWQNSSFDDTTPKLVRSFILVYILNINSWPPKFLSFSRSPPFIKNGTVSMLMAYKRNVVKCKMFQRLMFS